MLRLRCSDGLRNLLPSGVTRRLQSEFSTLVDAYKQAEALPGQTAALYSMSSILTDLAEPSEALKATVVWSTGLEKPKLLLSEDQVESFCGGSQISTESLKKGKRGAFFLQSDFMLPADGQKRWSIQADVDQSPAQVTRTA